MVENVEHFGAKLHVEPLGYFGVFGHRKIGVQEARSDNRISPKRAGMTCAGNDGVGLEVRRGRVAAGRNIAEGARDRKRRIGRRSARRNRRGSSGGRPVERLTQYWVAEILIWTARSGSTFQQVRSHRERDAWRRSDRHGRVQRIAGLQLRVVPFFVHSRSRAVPSSNRVQSAPSLRACPAAGLPRPRLGLRRRAAPPTCSLA